MVMERKVLILEPDDELAIMIEQFLRASRFLVVRARDPIQAKWMAPLICPHVVLVDYWPSDGVKIAEGFREDGLDSETPLVMIVPESIDEKNPDTAKALRENYNGFLYKPFADTDLIRVVENFTGFGDGREEDVGSALDDLDKQSSSPELKNAVAEIKKLQSKSKGSKDKAVEEAKLKKQIEEIEAKISDSEKLKKRIADLEAELKGIEKLDKMIDELESELDKSKKQSERQAARILELTNQIRELELDQTLACEAIEEEKEKLKDEVDTLAKRVKELEETGGEAAKMLKDVQKMLKEKIKL